MSGEQMSEAFAAAGLRDETPQEAAERIWKETKHDPIETMKRFEEWARQKPERMLGVLGEHWLRSVRTFLQRHPNKTAGGWKYASSFVRLFNKHRREQYNRQHLAEEKRRENIYHEMGKHDDYAQKKKQYTREYERRRKAGLKVIQAEVHAKTGRIVNLIDKEYGPFKGIRINGLKLPQVTTEQALEYCDKKTAQVRFIRALCQLIPDPRKPIGEQWTPDIIREAKRRAEVMNE